MHRQQCNLHQDSMAGTHHPRTPMRIPILAMATVTPTARRTHTATITTLNHQLTFQCVELMGVLSQSTGSQTWVVLTTVVQTAETSTCSLSIKTSFFLTSRS